jgi:hypothetical protein
MRQKLSRFMYGRYGIDELSKFLSYACLALIFLSVFFRDAARFVLFLPAIAGLIYSYYRMFSKDFSKRRQENAKYLHLKSRFDNWRRLRLHMWKQRKEYRFFKCPSCRAVLRVPKGKGKIRIVCKKCGSAFEKKS